MVSMGEIPRQGIVRRRMGDNASQNKSSCRMTSSKKGVRFNVTPPYARLGSGGPEAPLVTKTVRTVKPVKLVQI
jgi:hypothetical protein